MSFANFSAFITLAISLIIYSVSLYRKWMRPTWIKKHTGLEELKHLGETRPSGKKIRGTVVIAGGSVAGLGAARSCYDHFEKVIVVEPEAWLTTEEGVTVPPRKTKVAGSSTEKYMTPAHKRGHVAQWTSVHWFQLYSTWVMRKYFGEEYDDEIKADGSRVGVANYQFSNSNVEMQSPWQEYNGNLPTNVFVSRRTYETVLRRLVRRHCPNIEWVVGSVTGVVPDSHDKSRIASATVKLADSTEVNLECELLIDCAGPIHLGVKWLKEAGYGTMPQGQAVPKGKIEIKDVVTKYDPKMGYSTSEWKLTPEIIKNIKFPGGFENANWIWQYSPYAEKDHLSIVVGRIDGDYVHVSCGGWGPINLAKNVQEIYEHVDATEGIRPLPEWLRPMLDQFFTNEEEHSFHLLRVPACSLVSYEKTVNLPHNFIAMGDATMRVNPVFAQGCCKAMFGVASLDRCLRESSDCGISTGFAQKFFEVQANKTLPVWHSVKARDYAFKTTIPLPGETLEVGWFSRWYSHNLMLAAHWNPTVRTNFWHVRQFLAPPTDNYKPSVFFPIVFQWLTSYAQGPSWNLDTLKSALHPTVDIKTSSLLSSIQRMLPERPHVVS